MKTSTKLLVGGGIFLIIMSLCFQLYVKSQYRTLQERKLIGSGKVTDQEITITPFTELHIEDHIQVIYSTGDPKVMTRIDDNLHGIIELVQEKDVLRVKQKNNMPYYSDHDLTVVISNPVIKNIHLYNFCGLTISDTLHQEHLSLTAEDHSSMEAFIHCTELNLTMSNFASAELKGLVKKMQAACSEHSAVEAPSLLVDDLTITLSDFSSANCQVGTRLEASASDHAALSYKGKPSDKKVDQSDFAEIKEIE
jgi:hypothetical protein